MSAGFAITVDGTRLDPALEGQVKEIRIEQFLSKPAKFAIRFERDICNEDDYTLEEATIILNDSLVSVQVAAAEDSTDYVCLIQGPVTKFKTSQVLGGPGSWIEVHGSDRRVEMDREEHSVSWEGFAIDIMQSILQRYSIYEYDMLRPESSLQYDSERQLNQSGSDLKLLEQLARRHGYQFWISYDVGELGASEAVHLRPSPTRSDLGSPGLDVNTQGQEDAVLKVNVAERGCTNLTNFQLDIEMERATAIYVAAVLSDDGEISTTLVEPPQQQVTDPSLYQRPELEGTRRQIIRAIPEDAEAARAEAESMLDEESWFVKATGSTSLHLLGSILQPHQIVKVEGLDRLHVGNYQVEEVTHVVNEWGHLMDFKLRRNELSQTALAAVA